MFIGELPGRRHKGWETEAQATGRRKELRVQTRRETGGWGSGPEKGAGFPPSSIQPHFPSADQL